MTQATTYIPIVPPTYDLDAVLLAKVAQVSATLPLAFQGVAGTYAPAVIRMIQVGGWADLQTLYARLSGLSGPDALDQLHAYMSATELEAEKAQLTPLFEKAARDSYETRLLAQQIAQAAIRAGIGLALTALTF